MHRVGTSFMATESPIPRVVEWPKIGYCPSSKWKYSVEMIMEVAPAGYHLEPRAREDFASIARRCVRVSSHAATRERILPVLRLTWIALGLAACSSPDPVPADAPPATPPPLEELRGACEHAGGTLTAGECVCPTIPIGNASVRTNFDARGGGSCTRPQPGDPSCIVRGGFEHVLDTEGVDAIRACMRMPLYAFQRMTLQLRSPDAWKEPELRAAARWLDARLTAPATFYAKLSIPPDTVDVLEILVGITSLDVADVAASFVLPTPDPGNPNVAASTLHLVHVPSLDALDWALGNTLAGVAPTRNTTPAADAGAVGVALERALRETRFDFAGEVRVEGRLQRCIGICDLTQAQTLAGSGDPVHAWRIRRYEGGVVYRETLAIGSADGRRVDGWVVFDLGGEPSLLFRVDHGTSLLTPVVFAYDRDWRPLGSFRFELLPDASEASIAIANARPLGAGDTGVVLCDSGTTFDDASLNAALLVGPHRTAMPGVERGSLLGWVEAPVDDGIGFLDGVRNTVLGIYPTEVFPRLHGKNMARLLLGQDGAPIRILPRLLDRCIEGPDALASIDTSALQTRVVNVSGAEYLDAEACRARFPDGLDLRFLWVTASGNSGRRFTDDAPLARCPQTLPRRDNLLVVAAAEGTVPWPLTDFGSTYADLGADCAGVSGACSGSSNAAPRVSRTAALIVKEHGANISNAMIRMAILLGVTVPARALPFRSGGVHNHDDALRAARELVRGGFALRSSLTASEAQTVLRALYPDLAVADGKRQILEQNGAFAPLTRTRTALAAP